jgi:hypothetical protein
VTRGVIWALALLRAGAACFTNACNPVAFTAKSWDPPSSPSAPYRSCTESASCLWIGAALAVGTAVLTVLPERIWGNYSARMAATTASLRGLPWATKRR